MRMKDGDGVCEHCRSRFEYWLCHCGMAESMYAYCDSCGKTAILSERDKRIAPIAQLPLTTGDLCRNGVISPTARVRGRFRKGGTPRCFHCKHSLSAGAATSYIEAN